jgi:IS5 family transposase
MDKQVSFSQMEYSSKKKVTRREKFLQQMESVVPWQKWLSIIEESYPKGERGRPPIGAEKMLRMYLVQIWYDLADEAVEDALYDSQALRNFVGIDLVSESVPDATTLLKYRRMLEENGLTKKLFERLRDDLSASGKLLKEGTIVDASIIEAPCSTKNQKGERDQEMHSTKKNGQWHFGMKMHIGVDAVTGIVHSMETTAANIHDIRMTENLLHGEEHMVYADAGYTGIEKRKEIKSKHSNVEWRISIPRWKINKIEDSTEREQMYQREKAKTSVRGKVEYIFHIVKNRFGYKKVRYKGIEKNRVRLYALMASANLVILGQATPLPA